MSSPPRLFVPDALGPDPLITAAPEQAHYLGNVMRRAAGDGVVLFNGRDGAWAATIASIGRGRAVFGLGERLRVQADDADIWLVFAILKRDATDLVVRAATELGVSRILPVITERTGAARVNGDRLVTIAREAAEQSERLTVPDIAQPIDLYSCLSAWPAGRGLAVAIERQGAVGAWPAAPAALLIGPEGGFSPRELDFLRATPFVCGVTLGRRILRAETAVIAGLAALQARSWSNQ